MAVPKSVCVFCGSKTGNDPAFAEAARILGHTMANAGIRLVFGGGHIGLMGVVADAVLEEGGQVTGVIPKSLESLELAHPQVQDMHIVESMHVRKALMAESSEAFIALPGGLGTFEELCEIVTWAQLDFHKKPIIIFNQNGYYDSLLSLINHGIGQGFMTEEHRNLFQVAESVDMIMRLLDESFQ